MKKLTVVALVMLFSAVAVAQTVSIGGVTVTDVDLDGEITAIDVQLTINAALGLSVVGEGEKVIKAVWEGNGEVVVDKPAASWPVSTELVLSAIAGPGWFFSHWEGDLAGWSSKDAEFSIEGNMIVRAVFVQDVPHQTSIVFSTVANDLFAVAIFPGGASLAKMLSSPPSQTVSFEEVTDIGIQWMSPSTAPYFLQEEYSAVVGETGSTPLNFNGGGFDLSNPPADLKCVGYCRIGGAVFYFNHSAVPGYQNEVIMTRILDGTSLDW